MTRLVRPSLREILRHGGIGGASPSIESTAVGVSTPAGNLGGLQGPYLGTFTGLIPPNPDTAYAYPGWATDSSGRVWIHLGPNLWVYSLTIGGAYAPGQGGSIPSAKGTAVKFDGVTGKATTALIPTTGAWQMCGFVKSPSGGSGSQPLGSWAQGAIGAGAFIGAYGTVATLHQLTISDGTGPAVDASVATHLDDGNWHFFLAAVYNTSNDALVFAVDSLTNVLAFGDSTGAGSTALELAYNYTAATFGNVSMERIAWWDNPTAPLSPTVIANLYNDFVTGNPSDYDSRIKAAAPTAYWMMQESFGSAMLDSSGNGNGGAYVGGFTLGEPGAI